MLLIIVSIALFLQTDLILNLLTEKSIPISKIVILLSACVFALLFFVFFIKKSKHIIAIKIKRLVNGLLEGVFSIFKMKNKWAFIAHTIFIWTAYIGMFWVIKFTVPETSSLGIEPLLVAFVAGAFAMAATNGGLGVFPIVVSATLSIYDISSVSGDAFGWIMWISQTAMVVFFGAISFLLLPLLNRNK